jgi:hypothetical protein
MMPIAANPISSIAHVEGSGISGVRKKAALEIRLSNDLPRIVDALRKVKLLSNSRC